MKVETLELLQKLQKKFGIKGTPSGPFGKIVQKLLALSFHDMGFANIVERGVQGVDIDITSESNQKFAFEVKTTEKLSSNMNNEIAIETILIHISTLLVNSMTVTITSNAKILNM